MMSTYVFRFGYCTPAQWRANEAHGWDDESSAALRIEAATPEAAVSWGEEVAEAFSRFLFEQAGWAETIPSWRDARFANWIENPAESDISQSEQDRLPQVVVGQMPDFVSWTSE